ncbi:putative ribonuclease H-like domain-containing protein [Tanacetum coccineum]
MIRGCFISRGSWDVSRILCTNKVKSGFTGAYSTYTPSTSSTNIPEKEALAGFADEVIYSLFAKQSEDWDLLHEDLEQIDDLDIEEMDINWQIAMIAIRMKKECTAKGTHDGKKKRDSFYQHQEAGKQEKNQMGLLTMDDGIVNWGEHTEVEETNHALFVKKLEAQLVTLQKQLLSLNEKLTFQANEKYEKLKKYRRIRMKAVKEKEQLQKILDSWKDSSKNLWRLINSSMSSNSKVSLGYEIQSNNEVLSYEEEMNFSVFNCLEEDSVGKPLYIRFIKTNDFKCVPHPLNGDYTPTPQEEIDESLYVYGKKGPQEPEPSVLDDRSSEYSTCQSNDSAGSIGTSSEHSVDPESEISRVPPEVYVSTPITTNEKGVSAPKSKEEELECYDGKRTRGRLLFHKEEMFCLSHLIKDCDYYEKKMAKEAEVKKQRVCNTGNMMAKPVWTNTNRINHANQFVPRPVQLNSGRPNINSVRTNINTGRTNINSVRPRVNTVNTNVNIVRSRQPVPTRTSNSFSPKRPQVNLFNQRRHFSKSHSSVRRPFAKNTAQMSRSHAVKGNWGTAVKTSAGYNWRNSKPNSNCDSGPTFIRTDHPLKNMVDRGIFDSRCSGHMTGNKDQLEDFEEFNRGSVTFGGSKGYISGKGKIRVGNLDFDSVSFVKELGHFNLFSISQICDKQHKVLFTETECLVMSSDFKMPDENQILLKVPRHHNMYSFDMKTPTPAKGFACLIAKATSDESKLWHRRLGHINFKNLNKLVKGNLVRGLPSKVFKNDHTCVACHKGKQHKASCKAKLERLVIEPLHTLHMDLFGPTSVKSINHANYCLVIIDDCTRFSWVFFLASKDETSGILQNFIRQIENQLSNRVKIIRSDNGTEFKNRDMLEFCGNKGIKQEYSNARTPQQNGVAKRMNRALIKAARTMLANSLLPTTFWAEAVSTACYIFNRVRVIKPQNKTPYELLFGHNQLHKTFDGKSDEGFLVGYSLNSKAYRVYNLVTKRVEVNLHVNFLEDKPNVKGVGYRWMFDIDYLTDSMNYIPVSLENQANPHAGASEVTNSAGTSQTPYSNASEEKDEDVELIVVPSAVKNTEEKVESRTSSTNSKKEVILTEPQQEKKASSTDTSEDNPKILALRRELEEIALKHLGTVSENNSTSTPSVNTGSESVNTGRFDPDDSPMPELEIFHKSETGIFDEASIRNKLQLADASGITMLPNNEIFEGMGHMGYPTDGSFTFWKSFFTPQWRFLVHHILHCISSKSGGWDQFGSNIATALICLSTGRVYNFSKLIFDGMVANLKSKTKFLMYPRFLQLILDIQTENKHPYLAVTLTKKIFGNMKRGFRGAPRPLLPAMLLVATTNPSAGQEHPDVAQSQPSSSTIPDKYVAEILKKFDLVNVKTTITPMETKSALTKGKMKLVTPKTSHLNAVKRIFKYLKGKPHLGLWYPRESPFDLDAFSDSDYGGSNIDRKSIIAEYVAAANCCGQVLWVQNQLLDYGFNFMNTKIHIDNESTICIVKNPVYHSKIKHIEIRHHFIRDCYEKKLIRFAEIVDFLRGSNLRIDGLEKDLKQTKLIMGSAIVKLVKKVKKLEGILKRKNVVFSDPEEEEPEDQGRKSQDDPLVSLVQGLVTPSKTTVNILGEEQVEDISPNTLEAAKTLSRVILAIKSCAVSGQVSTDSINKSISSPNKGQREGKAPMIIEEAPKKTKEQILQEEASLAEAIRLDTLEKEEKAKQVHLDSLLAQRIAEEEEMNEQQKKRRAQVQFEA